MSTIPTAEELFSKMNPQDGSLPKWAKDFAIKLTEIHVVAALKQASEKKYKSSIGEVYVYHTPLAKESILNAYPLDNIK